MLILTLNCIYSRCIDVSDLFYLGKDTGLFQGTAPTHKKDSVTPTDKLTKTMSKSKGYIKHDVGSKPFLGDQWEHFQSFSFCRGKGFNLWAEKVTNTLIKTRTQNPVNKSRAFHPQTIKLELGCTHLDSRNNLIWDVKEVTTNKHLK